MGTSNLMYYNGRYKGDLSDNCCSMLESMLQLKSNGGDIPEFHHLIYNLDDNDVDRLIEDFKLNSKITIDIERPLGNLRNYQTIAIGFLYYAESCILGDSVGMGKTVEVSGLLNLLDTESKKKFGKPCHYLFCTEKKLVTQVHKELIKFTGKYVYPIFDATQAKVKKFQSEFPASETLPYNIVASHNIIKNNEFIVWLSQYMSAHKESPFDVIIIDESSVLGGSKSKIHDAFKTLRKYFKRVYFLNATPMETGLKVLYNQLNLLDNKYMPTIQNFQKQFVVMDYTGFYPRETNKYKNVDEFRELVGYKYFANTRKDNGAVMEGCTGGVIVSGLTVRQKSLMKESQLKQMIVDCPSYIDDGIPFDAYNVPKLGALKRLFEQECKEYKSIIVFVHFREAQRAIEEWCNTNGYTNRVLNGDTTFNDTEEIVDGFKNEKFRVLITNVQKGLNFNGCNCCIFYSIISNPSKMVQFEGRMTRGFDIHDKAVYMIVSEGDELKTVTTTVKDRVEAMETVTNTDYSIVLRILKDVQGAIIDG